MNPVTASIAITAIGTGVTIFSVILTVNKGTAQSAQQTGAILQAITDIKEDLREIKTEAKDTSFRLNNLDSRLSKVEGFVSDGDKRLQALERENK